VTGYRIDHELGRGGMAVVYAGRQEQLDRPVALKVLAEHLAGDDEFRDRFLREARIAGRLHHPHLVRTYDITELDGLPCIVMELLPGGTLHGSKLTHEEARDVAGALAYAHAQGVIHRDLKPANLLRSETGAVKIGDFGIARAAEETMVTQAGTVLGTLRYLAPEQAAGHPVGPEADVYSFGVVLGELLDPPLPALVERCCAPDPRDRPTAEEVEALLSPTGATRIKTGVRPRRGFDRRLAVLAAAALLAIVAAIVVAVWPHHHAPATVSPVQHGTTATQQARNLATWLQQNSR